MYNDSSRSNLSLGKMSRCIRSRRFVLCFGFALLAGTTAFLTFHSPYVNNKLYPTPEIHIHPAPANTFSHTYRPDGLLHVGATGVHPITQLMDKAKKEWEAKVERQSKTLKEAVAEYKLRYGRLPPRGFDKWCVLSNLCKPHIS